MMKSSRDILKLVDQLVKANNLEKALQEVKKAREVDPKNLYAFAYEERIKELILQRERQEPRGSKSISDSVAVERGFKPYDVREHILNEHTDRFGSKVPALYEEFKKAGLRSSEERENRAKKGATREALDTYRQALLLIWSDGQKTEDEIRELQDLRQSLLITEEEHEVMERKLNRASRRFEGASMSPARTIRSSKRIWLLSGNQRDRGTSLPSSTMTIRC
jgi:tetratricopeptide (TPR) repeat protein